ncbi:hypothetical protein [Streptomyces yaizuensis]|uniref:Lantibiotic dehydratase N-terminal domain-containing protein n=1 Tax=Streptomyces yaizuensis TaxID=2989713 RepID=A0ABQ5P285_9ACTN|nr:hypothetical protein [Streptomyces sp. YSPA8]GLF96717.1 hypothetical protein SYYSPA8_20490 [Streptomyces sp. YSPA8]
MAVASEQERRAARAEQGARAEQDTAADVRPGAGGHGTTLGPFAVRRRCRLPGSLVAELGSDRVWRLAGQWAAADDASRALGSALADRIGARVPALGPQDRRELLRVRRAAFNTRPLPDIPGLRALLGTTGEPITAYAQALTARDTARHGLAQALDALATAAGSAVDTALRDPEIAWSVELSVPGLLAAGPVGALDPAAGRKARRRALTLFRLVHRAATKPTPFAGFATTHLIGGDAVESPPRRHTRVDREALDLVRGWIAAGGYQGLRPERLWLTVNPTATVREHDGGPRVSWLVTTGGGAEHIRSAGCGPALTRTLGALRTPVRLDTVAPDGTLPAALRTLIERGLLEVGPVLPTHGRRTLHAAVEATTPAAAEHRATAEAAASADHRDTAEATTPTDHRPTAATTTSADHRDTPDATTPANHRDTPEPTTPTDHRVTAVHTEAHPEVPTDVPTHVPTEIHTAAHTELHSEVHTEVHAALRVLRGAEDALVGPDPERVSALRSAREGVGALARALGADARAAARATVSEDVVGAGPDDGILCLPPDVLADLGRVQRVVPLLSHELPFQLAGGLAFRRRFGADAVPVTVAYQWFLESGRAETDALLARCADDELTTVLALRRRLFEGLRETARQPGAEAACDPALLDSVAAGLPAAVLDPACASWPVQRAGDRLVLNGVGGGYGRFAARVAGGLDDERAAGPRAWAARAHPPLEGGLMVDISALLGATVNEHPLVLPAALGYPGRALECDPGTRIDLSECVVRAVGGRPLLFSDRFPGRPLFPVPHNSTLATVAPGLYRWLSRFGPAAGATLDLWDHVDALPTADTAATGDAPATKDTGRPAGPGDGIRHYPRLTLGRLVLTRRTWKVPGAALPATAPRSGAADTACVAETVTAWHRWCERTGVPRRSFLRTTTLPDPWDVVRGLADMSPVLAARSTSGAAIRKPLYVDLSQPLCWPTGPAGAPVAPGTTLTFTEPLPDPVHPAGGDGGDGGDGVDGHVTEYVLELSRPPRPPATGHAG